MLLRLNRAATIAAALVAIAPAIPVTAGTATSNLNVTASVAAVCTITTSPVAFGSYDPVVANATADLLATGSLTVACTKGATAAIDLDRGANYSGGTRRMSGGSDFLNYALYRNAGRTQVWGSGLPGGSTVTYNSGSRASTAFTVYGKVPQAQDVGVGSYSDTVVATVNY